MTKEKAVNIEEVKWISERILSEYKKHYNVINEPDTWATLAAIKILSGLKRRRDND